MQFKVPMFEALVTEASLHRNCKYQQIQLTDDNYSLMSVDLYLDPCPWISTQQVHTTNLLTVLFAHTALGAHSFSVTSPKTWNSLLPTLHSCNWPDTFHPVFSSMTTKMTKTFWIIVNETKTKTKIETREENEIEINGILVLMTLTRISEAKFGI